MFIKPNNKESLVMAQQQAAKIREICLPLFNASPVQAFLFIKLMPDGTILALSTHPNWLESLYCHQSWFSSTTVQDAILRASRLGCYAQLWPYHRDGWREMMHSIGLQGGLNLWRRSGDAVVGWFFGGFEQHDYSNLMVHSIDDCKMFADHFEKQATSIIAMIHDFPCSIFGFSQKIPVKPKDAFEEFIGETPIKYFPIVYNQKKYKITYRQALCLQGLLEGKSCKVLGKEMGVSSRTVEKHIENIKFNLDLCSRDEMLSMYKASRSGWL
jgi:DNA-binding CsgD family transcriptional regulator